MAKFSASSISKPNLKSSGKATFQAQQAIGSASGAQIATIGPGQAAQMKANVTRQEGQEKAQNLAKDVQQEGQRGQIAINKNATQQRAKMSQRRDASRSNALNARQRISGMGRDLEKKLFDERMEFEYDARGIRFKNERQLADFKKMTAKDDEEYQNFAQQTMQRSSEKRKLYQIAHAKISQELSMLSKARESEANFQQKKRLLKAKADIEAKIKSDAAKAKNRAMIFQGVGAVAGGALGSLAGPAGIAAGAQAGSALGTAGAAATS